MCYTPIISASTAGLEFIVAGYIFFRYRLTNFTKFIIPFIILLGLYQLSEFMLCLTNQSRLWVTAGLIIYSFLPAVALHFVASYTGFKTRHWQFIYLLPIIFSLIAILTPNFVAYGSCNTVFVSTQTLYSAGLAEPLAFAYWLFYFGYIILAAIFLLSAQRKEENKVKRIIYLIGIIGIFITLLPPLILIIIMPSLGLKFPSIYCQFALLFALLALVGAAYDKQVSKLKS